MRYTYGNVRYALVWTEYIDQIGYKYEEFYKLKVLRPWRIERMKEDYDVVNVYLIYTYQIKFVENMFRIWQVTL